MKFCIVTYDEYINIPYIKKYEEILKRNNLEYDIILWNRRNIENKIYIKGSRTFVFEKITRKSKLSKAIQFVEWRRFVLNVLKQGKYTKLIILTTIPGILISDYLFRNFKNRYLFDIRDFTYENIPFYKYKVDKLVEYSGLTTISSRGFYSWLKESKKIILTHNLTNLEHEFIKKQKMQKKITIGFVGGIRYQKENEKLIAAFANKNDVELVYIGKRHDGINFEKYCKERRIKNVSFYPEFKNEEKPLIYQKIDLINSVYGSDTPVVRTALPNKLYDCIIFKKPIIVSKNTYLSEIVDKYNLGFSIDLKKDDIYKDFRNYLEHFNINLFFEGCISFKKKVIQEEEYSLKKIELFLTEE